MNNQVYMVSMMRCTSYCTAFSYETPRLYQALQKRGSSQLYRDVIHCQIKEYPHSELFFFSYGAVVCWGLTEEQEREVLLFLKEFERDSLPKAEIDEFSFSYAEKMLIEEDEIFLQNKGLLIKVAISHGLAQSVKLTTFEEMVQRTIDHSKKLPEDLAAKGKISLSRKEISQRMGELFIERNFINLHSEVLDTPEFFWEHPELENFYRRTAHYLDVGKRSEVLNRRLTVIHELFEILSNEFNHQHSARLEWTIIILIVIEVIIGVLRDLFHLF